MKPYSHGWNALIERIVRATPPLKSLLKQSMESGIWPLEYASASSPVKQCACRSSNQTPAEAFDDHRRTAARTEMTRFRFMGALSSGGCSRRAVRDVARVARGSLGF